MKSNMLKMILENLLNANKVLYVVLHYNPCSDTWVWVFYEYGKYNV